jgi:hypothetical protein
MTKTKRKINMRKINRTKINRTKINRKKRGTRRTRSCHKGGTILGMGKDGAIIDSLSCNGFSRETGYVAKIFKNECIINFELNDKLAEIDPDNLRFNRYYFPSIDSCDKEMKTNSDILNLKKIGGFQDTIGFQKLLIPMDPNEMTKPQYKHLRESVQILNDNGIFHGDLPGNVMIDKSDGLPRIIDWESANVGKSKYVSDWDVFLTHFKVTKPEP